MTAIAADVPSLAPCRQVASRKCSAVSQRLISSLRCS